MTTNLSTSTAGLPGRVQPMAHQYQNKAMNISWKESSRDRDWSSTFEETADVAKDCRILERIGQALRDSGYEQLGKVRTYCDHGRITLQGRVATFYLKQVAQEVVRSVAEVRDIDNDLHVICAR